MKLSMGQGAPGGLMPHTRGRLAPSLLSESKVDAVLIYAVINREREHSLVKVDIDNCGRVITKKQRVAPPQPHCVHGWRTDHCTCRPTPLPYLRATRGTGTTVHTAETADTAGTADSATYCGIDTAGFCGRCEYYGHSDTADTRILRTPQETSDTTGDCGHCRRLRILGRPDVVDEL
ncbi:hypothetical protein NP493_405g04022 [Ridgeia piscesae]|uniref:Uncharacterized protein n=1 Tax=Ridgeia piscesae TaxID=27915 RepID=A0AAD9L1C0_RIDPI|nr:hypothetical protein NP493_405g04022 [Ridgeia piscesae]